MLNAWPKGAGLTFDVQFLLHVLDVNGGFLLNKIQDFNGVGHPEENVLEVGQQVRDGEAGERRRILADKTRGELKGIPPMHFPDFSLHWALAFKWDPGLLA